MSAARQKSVSILAILAGIIVGLGVSGSTANATSVPDVITRDLAQRSHDIHWPVGYSPTTADMFSHNEIVINADCSTVWHHLIAARKSLLATS